MTQKPTPHRVGQTHRLVFPVLHTCLTSFFPGLPRWAGTRKVKHDLDFTEARDSEWQWHQLGHMQVCTLLQTDNHTSTPPLSFYRPDALPAAQPTMSKHWRQIVFPVYASINKVAASISLLYTLDFAQGTITAQHNVPFSPSLPVWAFHCQLSNSTHFTVYLLDFNQTKDKLLTFGWPWAINRVRMTSNGWEASVARQPATPPQIKLVKGRTVTASDDGTDCHTWCVNISKLEN